MGKPDPSQDLLRVTAIMLVLFAVIGFSWKWVTDRQPVSADQSAAIAEQGEVMTQLLQDELTEQLAGPPQNEEQERIDSPLGQALLRKCLEWTEFYDNHPDESARTNRDTACDEYSAFIATGNVPP